MSVISATKKRILRGVDKVYAPIKAISPAAIGGGLVAGHVAGGYSGSAAAQANLYHIGRQDALSKQAGLLNRIVAARGAVTAAGNTAKGVISDGVNSLKRTSIGQSAISNASKVAKSPFGSRVSNGVKSVKNSSAFKRTTGWVSSNPMKSMGIAAAGGLAAGSMTKSSGLYNRALKSLQESAKRHPVSAKVIGGTGAFGASLGVSHLVDEKIDTAVGKAAVYPYRKQHGYINQ